MNNFKIKYGLNYVNSIDITTEILDKYLIKEDNVVYIPKDTNFNSIKGDPYFGIVKNIIIYNEYIKYFKENLNEHIIIDFNENKFNFKYGLNINDSIDITTEILDKYLCQNIIHIPKDTEFNSIKGDPYPNIVKTLFIKYNSVNLQFNEYLDKDLRFIYLNKNNTTQTIGFIILRHVVCDKTNNYWINSYNCIRKIYPENLILIIDDNSDYKYITNIDLYKTTIIDSEYPKRGELLPYYYYLKNKLFDKAVIIHDSVFINEYIDTDIINYKMLWEFEPNDDHKEDILKILNKFNDKELLNFYESKLWKGCFGGICIITHDFLTSINNKYDFSLLLEVISSRYNRESFERVFACLLQINYKNNSMFGNIYKYCPWGIEFKDKDNFKHLPITKVWSGR